MDINKRNLINAIQAYDTTLGDTMLMHKSTGDLQDLLKSYKTLYDMPLHSSVTVKDVLIIRVVGGWLYDYDYHAEYQGDAYSNNRKGLIFIPCRNTKAK